MTTPSQKTGKKIAAWIVILSIPAAIISIIGNEVGFAILGKVALLVGGFLIWVGLIMWAVTTLIPRSK